MLFPVPQEKKHPIGAVFSWVNNGFRHAERMPLSAEK